MDIQINNNLTCWSWENNNLKAASLSLQSSVLTSHDQAPVVQKVDSAIRWVNLHPLDSAIGFPNTYPLDNGSSCG